jgi:hypothetical protein
LIRRLLLLAGTALLVAFASGPGHAISGSGIVAKYNALRVANGFPAGIVEDSDWSRKCALHNHYAALNGNDTPNPHQETPGKPGYTADGDWAARNGLLGGSAIWYDVWQEELLPFAAAPFHMAAIMNPRATRMGAADTESSVCVGVSAEPARARPAADTLYSYPGNGQSIQWAINTGGEYPYSPNRLAGLPDDLVTGPNIIVFWDGPAGVSQLTRLVGATLAGPSGAVAIKTVGRDQGSFVAPSSGFIIPVKPLAPGTSYQGTATFADDAGARRFTGSFSFTTTPYVPTARLVRFDRPARVPPENKPYLNLVVHNAFPLQYAGASCTIRANYSNGNRVPTSQRAPCRTNPFSIPKAPAGGSVKITVDVAPFTVGDVKYPGATVSKVYAGPAVSTVVGHIGYSRSFSYRRIARAGFPVSVQLAQAGSRVGVLLRNGKAIYGASELMKATAASRVTLRVHVSPALGSLVQRTGRAALTLDVRVFPPAESQVDVLKRVTFTR